MRGQITLETIIMLVVLLVLAGVMITLILTTLKPPTAPAKVLSKQEFLSMCENYCNDPERSVEYCRMYWNGRDWNGNNIPSELIRVGTYNWYACEDRIYCFLVKPCERLGSGIDLLRRCKELICGVYMDVYGDAKLATARLLQDISFSGRCKFSGVPIIENWYEKIFMEGCIGRRDAGGVTGGLTLQDCKVDISTKKVECLTNCQSATLLVVSGRDANGKEIVVFGKPTISQGKVSLIDSRIEELNEREDIGVVLTCESPDDEAVAIIPAKSS